MLDVGSQSFETFRLDYYSPDRGSLSRSPRETWSTTSPSAAAMPTVSARRAAISCSSARRGWGRRSSRPASRGVVSEDGYSVVYDTASHIFSLLEDAKFRRGDEDDEETRRLDQCDLLIIDDLARR